MGRLYRFENGLPPVLETPNEDQRLVDDYGNVYQVSILENERVVALIVPARFIFHLEEWRDPHTGERDKDKDFVSPFNATFVRDSGTFKIMRGLTENYLKNGGKVNY